MKRTILILLFFSWQLYIWSQVNDIIITKSGETIICRLDSITPTHIYFTTVVRNNMVQTYIEMSMVSKYQPYILTEGYIYYKQDKLFPREAMVKEDFIDFSRDKPFVKKGKVEAYNTWITLNNSSLTYKGILYEVNDYSITLSGSAVIKDYFNNQETMTFQVSDIQIIMTRRKKNAVRGLWIGAVSGVGASFLVGFIGSRWNVSSGGYYTLFFGIPAAFIGAGIGAIIASIPFKITIHGNQKSYDRHRKMLEKRSLR